MRIKILLEIFGFSLLTSFLIADWRDDLRRELWNQGYSQQQIDQAVKLESKRKKLGQSLEAFYEIIPIEEVNVSPDFMSVDEPKNKLDPIYISELENMGYHGRSLKKQLNHIENLTQLERENYLQELRDEYSRVKWINGEMSRIRLLLENNGWGSYELNKRIKRERKFYTRMWDLEKHDQSTQIKTEREHFETELARDYIAKVDLQLRLNLSEEIEKDLLFHLDDFINKPSKKRGLIVSQLVKDIKMEIVEEKELDFDKVSKFIIHELKKTWGERSLTMVERRDRREEIEMLCEDLAHAEDELQYNQTLDKRLKDFKRNGYSREEISTIKKELIGLKP